VATEESDFIEDETPAAEHDRDLLGFRDPPGEQATAPAPPGGRQPGEFEENVEPNSTLGDAELVGSRDTELHLYETRRKLAMGLLWLVGALAGLPTVALIFGHWLHFKSDDYREVSLVFTPIVALASAAFGFFFASDERRF
jgi:hypothetical protein